RSIRWWMGRSGGKKKLHLPGDESPHSSFQKMKARGRSLQHGTYPLPARPAKGVSIPSSGCHAHARKAWACLGGQVLQRQPTFVETNQASLIPSAQLAKGVSIFLPRTPINVARGISTIITGPTGLRALPFLDNRTHP